MTKEIDSSALTKFKYFTNGSYGNIHKATLDGEKEVILKSDRKKDTTHTKNEYQTLASILPHPNIVILLGFSIWNSDFMMVLEYAEFGTLDDYYRSIETSDIPYLSAIGYMLDVASALEYLHSQERAFLDLKPNNVLLFSEPIQAKLSDFGLCRKTSELMELSGSPHYLDPAQVRIAKNKHDQHHTNTGSDAHNLMFPVELAFDIYSFAILLCTCLHGNRPYTDEISKLPQMSTIMLLAENKVPKPSLDDASEAFADIITRCWDNNRAARPTIHETKQALQEAFMSPVKI